MRMSLVPIAAARRSVSAAVLASMVSLFVFYAADPAAARVVLSQCQRKHSFCLERCIMNNKTIDAGNACIKRTCDKQHAGCGTSSIGTNSGGGKLIQTNPGGSAGGPTGGIFVPKSGGAVQKIGHKPEPKPVPTAEPKPAPKTPDGSWTTTTTIPAKPTVRNHRATPKFGDDRSSPGVKKTRYPYDIGESDSGRKGPSEKRLTETRDHRGADAASRQGTSKKRKHETRDHRGSNAGSSRDAAAASNCGSPANRSCQRQ
jgi:hypothetical protein